MAVLQYVKYSKTSKILRLILIVCIYILFSKIFPILKIPYSFLEPDTNELFNNIIEELSIGYLSGYFIYFMTVEYKYMLERKKRKYELYDLSQEFAKAFEDVENATGRIEVMEIDTYKNICTSELIGQLHIELTSLLNKAYLYKDILLQNEIDYLGSIRRLVGGLEGYNEFANEKEVKARLITLQDARKTVTLLEKSLYI